MFCLEGEVEYRVAGQVYYLEAGDSLMFQANQPHCWCCLSERAAKLLLVFHAVDESERWWRIPTVSSADWIQKLGLLLHGPKLHAPRLPTDGPGKH